VPRKECGMRRYRTIKQSDSYSCFACCACMITGETLKKFIKYIGHDGSEPDPNESHPSKCRGFTDREVVLYLVDRGYALGTSPEWSIPIRFNGDPNEVIKIEIPITEPAILLVESEMLSGYFHCVFWDGEWVRDPNPKRPAKSKLGEYKIREWSQVIIL